MVKHYKDVPKSEPLSGSLPGMPQPPSFTPTPAPVTFVPPTESMPLIPELKVSVTPAAPPVQTEIFAVRAAKVTSVIGKNCTKLAHDLAFIQAKVNTGRLNAEQASVQLTPIIQRLQKISEQIAEVAKDGLTVLPEVYPY